MGGGGEMTNEQINVAIAQACGWTILKKPLSGFGFAAYAKEPNGDPSPGIPDYCDDLNAMHEAEKTVFGNSILWVEFMERLCDATGAVNTSMVDAMVIIIQATARQRAEAFLKTVKLDSPQETL